MSGVAIGRPTLANSGKPAYVIQKLGPTLITLLATDRVHDGHDAAMSLSRSTRISILLFIDVIFFFVELIAG